ncbi:hypothetical protein [Streptomyces hilarionis]|uniref:hypothetical protein n=1 Tax=Streptomyces hilarionis TaxID=2839954 RepID=UPI002119BC62|nr:hypothetical protein [Streptomyces hilarionis]MCQ9134237.1 hypothetical protein [Streptomyces hilarionis]
MRKTLVAAAAGATLLLTAGTATAAQSTPENLAIPGAGFKGTLTTSDTFEVSLSGKLTVTDPTACYYVQAGVSVWIGKPQEPRTYVSSRTHCGPGTYDVTTPNVKWSAGVRGPSAHLCKVTNEPPASNEPCHPFPPSA